METAIEQHFAADAKRWATRPSVWASSGMPISNTRRRASVRAGSRARSGRSRRRCGVEQAAAARGGAAHPCCLVPLMAASACASTWLRERIFPRRSAACGSPATVSAPVVAAEEAVIFIPSRPSSRSVNRRDPGSSSRTISKCPPAARYVERTRQAAMLAAMPRHPDYPPPIGSNLISLDSRKEPALHAMATTILREGPSGIG